MTIGKVVVLTRGTFMNDSMDIFNSVIPPGWQASVVDMNAGEQKVMQELRDAEYLITWGSGQVPLKLVENAPKLKLIQMGGQDTGHLPVKWALDKGIPVANAGGANAVSVAEYVVFLMLGCLRNFPQYDEDIREGKWRASVGRVRSHELFDRTVGIVGFGNIGRRVAHLCYAFGAGIVYYERFFVPYALRADTKARPVSLDELLRISDIVTLHIPALTTNRRMIGYEELCKMKPTAYVINTSRGANLDEEALLRALQEKRIAGAALDVWDPEPPKPDNPLLKLPNVIATPHVAGLVEENIAPSFETVWRNVVMVSEGKEPLNRIREF